ncbi:unnamed protein product [Ostreobium quekettii]|uniref:Aprataxin C2HE/C2H2/C2HC zinc finger domain-containing protein n=1 Tax=Ostreobium quekettii TaxID=121088 RepID=A0A8S1INT9_9CHLO|nr:unnamed protein product [Ostreobium quekettii]
MGTLVFPNGAKMALALGACVELGRAHLGAIWGAIHVSRVQCEVQLMAGGPNGPGRLRVVSRSKVNPTGIDGRGDGIGIGDEEMGEAESNGVGGALDGASQAAGSGREACWSNPTLLILVGVQGSGKSTFCEELARGGPVEWRRVNQDEMRRSGRGKRQDCVAAAGRVLGSGRNCVIDRMNLTADQRKPFIQVARRLGCAVHAIVLNLHPDVCANRVAQRKNHEGNVEGNKGRGLAYASYRDLSQCGPPSLTEGISTVTICNSPEDVQKVLHVWKGYSGSSLKAEDSAHKIHWPPAADVPEAGEAMVNWPHSGGTSKGGAGRMKGRSTANTRTGGNNRLMPSEGAQGTLLTLSSGGVPLKRNAFQMMMEAASRQGEALHKHGADLAEDEKSGKQPRTAGGGGRGSRHGWQDVLVQKAQNPERFREEDPDMLVDDTTIVLKDMYPKARQHYLVVSRDPELLGISDLRRKHIPHLHHMQKMAEQRLSAVKSPDGEIALERFRMGFHTLPSLCQLHLHVISDDFDSVCLKHKKHWNSFTTPFFKPLAEVVARLEEGGEVAVNQEEAEGYLKWDLRCHRCQRGMGKIPQLKEHIAHCTGGE